ncbi:hypothetical protein Naga_100576g2 [Nannochloropsis gaditana]|uniref:Uncharacterized protein n=1 Tax=Nannochloropsis gaditana TaxID=72520 RepID=W7U1Y1_9STRA|nr:hypothetical protein Naga_100576g2 [Nannochloropsis gaditana]
MARCFVDCTGPAISPSPSKLVFLTIMLCFVTSFALQRHDPTLSVSCSASSPPSSSSSPTNSAQSSPFPPPSLPRVRGPRELGRMLEEEKTRALAQEREADERRFQFETEMDAEGIRRPRDRKLSFTPAPAFLSSSHVRERPGGKGSADTKARMNIEPMATGGMAAAEEEGELAIDRHMLRKAYEVRRAQVESLSRFQSKRKRHGRQSGQVGAQGRIVGGDGEKKMGEGFLLMGGGRGEGRGGKGPISISQRHHRTYFSNAHRIRRGRHSFVYASSFRTGPL